MATKASLASAIRTAATQVSGSTNTTSAESKQAYASSRIGLGLGPGVTRSASINTVTTAPNFYSPFLTPSSFQIPNARREVYLWANWWKNNEPKVSAAINFYTNYPFSGGEIDNIVRKCIMENVLQGEQPSFNTILSFCNQEKWEASTKGNKIGY